MIPFDVKSVFLTFDWQTLFSVKQIFEDYKIIVKFIKFKKLIHVSFDNEIYEQTDGAVMGSPMDPALANKSIIKQETNFAS